MLSSNHQPGFPAPNPAVEGGIVVVATDTVTESGVVPFSVAVAGDTVQAIAPPEQTMFTDVLAPFHALT